MQTKHISFSFVFSCSFLMYRTPNNGGCAHISLVKVAGHAFVFQKSSDSNTIVCCGLLRLHMEVSALNAYASHALIAVTVFFTIRSRILLLLSFSLGSEMFVLC